VIAREALEEMLSRLEWMAVKPSVIIDAGCGLAEASLQLQKRYPLAQILSLDNSTAMLTEANASFRVCAAAEVLPLANQSVNFIFANMLLPWVAEPKKLLREWRRVLRPDGLLMFSTLGLDTLRECRAMTAASLFPMLLDMHDIGDELMAAGFSDPVLDVNYYTTSYRSKEKLLAELQASGMLFAGSETAIQENMPPSTEGKYEVTYEVVYAHAFAPSSEASTTAANGEFKIPVSQLIKTRD